MVKGITSAKEWVARNSLKAYLEGGKDLDWTVDSLRNSGVRGQDLAEIFDFLKDYSETARYQEVYSKCKELGWL